jgi:hypothetical protein
LWFPATIHHVIDSDSPLYYIITGQPRPTEGGLYHRGHRHFNNHHEHPVAAETSTTAVLHRGMGNPSTSGGMASGQAFQIAVVFEATDSATSTIIESKHIYTPDTLIAHYHFAVSTLLTQKAAEDGSVVNHHGIAVSAKHTFIDYFRFNELVPDDDDDDDVDYAD